MSKKGTSASPSLVGSKLTTENNTRTQTPDNNKEEQEEEPKDIEIEALKERALKEVRQQYKYDKKHSQVCSTPAFLDFMKTELCDNMVVATIFYVSSTLWLQVGPELDDIAAAEQEQLQSDSFRILSGLYCRILLSPISSNLRVREERIFYETLIFFLDACACFAVHIENPDMVYELLAQVFRRGLQDPHARHKSEFLPITEIVRRHWLSQRVPGKNRAEISHSTLQGTTQLIEPMCQKEVSRNRNSPPPSQEVWDKNGFPKNTNVPYQDKVIPRTKIVNLTPPKQDDSTTSHVPTREVSPRVDKPKKVK